jgi:ATP-dependent DNA helicase RecG
MYGDLDISRITDMPKGRQRVDTFLVNEEYRLRLNNFILKQVSLGGQIYVVCPSIEKKEDGDEYIIDFIGQESYNSNSLNLKNAVEYAEELKRSLPDLTIEVLHGKMSPREKDEIMARFSSAETNVLVSTTVIEVGVNVPNASVMIVENAERFGLSQLHQLRGRVGRGTRKSYCILVSDANTEKAQDRLSVMKNVYDGYEIAEKDLLLRGPGDFFSSISDNNFRQSGGFEFKYASMCDDSELFTKAFSVAKIIIENDPKLELPEHKLLNIEVFSRLKNNSSTIS